MKGDENNSRKVVAADNRRVAISTQSGLSHHKWDSLDTTLLWALERPIEDTTLDPATIASLKAKGVKTAAQGAITRLLDAPDLRIVKDALKMIYGRAPKVVVHDIEDLDISRTPTSKLLKLLNFSAIEAEVLTDQDTAPNHPQ